MEIIITEIWGNKKGGIVIGETEKGTKTFRANKRVFRKLWAEAGICSLIDATVREKKKFFYDPDYEIIDFVVVEKRR